VEPPEEEVLKYHGFITEEKNTGDILKSTFRGYYIPVEERDGGWMPAGPATEDPDDQVNLYSRVYSFQVYRLGDPTGPLDDLPSPDGHTVVCRYWLPDDYRPATPEERAAKRAEAEQAAKEIMKRCKE
jgi:hypothetical protein